MAAQTSGMLYPSLHDLQEKVGSRYLLVNEVAHRARRIASESMDKGVKLTEKPVKLAILEIASARPEDLREELKHE